MYNLDKKIICSILLFVLLLCSNSFIVNADYTDSTVRTQNSSTPTPPLKTNTESANLYYDHVLTASGDLYRYEEKNYRLKKVNSNVSKYVYCGDGYGFYLKDNSAYLESNFKLVKEIKDVKDIAFDGGLSILTNKNELYRMGFVNKKLIKIDSDINEIIGSAVYYKDGKTYDLDGHDIIDGKVDNAYNFDGSCYFSKNNVLYKMYSMGRYDKITDKFLKFEYNGFQYPTEIKCNDGSTLDFGFFSYSSDRYLSNMKSVVTDENYKITNVKAMSSGTANGYWELFLRTDGSAWIFVKNKGPVCVLENTKNEETKIEAKDDDNAGSENKDNEIIFKDVPKNAWYYEAVKYAYENNLIKGYNDTTFAPNDNLTRGMLVTILFRFEGAKANDGKSKFADVDSKQWYAQPIKWASENGVVAGYNNGTFGPEDNITREQLAVILYRYAGHTNKDVSKTDDLKKFSDTGNISDYAVKAMKWAVGAGVITGNANGTLNPKGNATRAEVAAMMTKYCKNVGK